MFASANKDEGLRAWLAVGVERGFLTDQIPRHVEIGRAYLRHVGACDRWLDLGSGGGIPGLVVGCERPESEGILLDAGHRRCEFLREAIAAIPLPQVVVSEGRGEVIARSFGEPVDVVIARSFNPPAVTAEIAARFLKPGGTLVVSEPPATPAAERWPSAGLDALGLEFRDLDCVDHAVHLAVIQKVSDTPDQYPRRDGKPAKAPLW